MPGQFEDNVRKVIENMPHAVDLRMKVVELGQGKAKLTMPYDDRLIGDPETRVIAGGAVSALMDTTCGAAVIVHPDNDGGMTATLDLRIDYMRSAKPGEAITSAAECYHRTRSIAFVRAVAWDDNEATPVAMATGAFTVEDPAT